jgi:hypothetical protein
LSRFTQEARRPREHSDVMATSMRIEDVHLSWSVGSTSAQSTPPSGSEGTMFL